jgi:Domain of unknown function (DUF4157)
MDRERPQSAGAAESAAHGEREDRSRAAYTIPAGVSDHYAQHFAAATSGPPSAVPYREHMENVFSESFSGVNAHLGQAGPLGAMDAAAAASGETLSFASHTPGQAEVAHELAHVVQHRRGAGSAPVSTPGDAAEREADGAARAAVAGAQVSVEERASASLHRLLAADLAGLPVAKVAGKGPDQPNMWTVKLTMKRLDALHASVRGRDGEKADFHTVTDAKEPTEVQYEMVDDREPAPPPPDSDDKERKAGAPPQRRDIADEEGAVDLPRANHILFDISIGGIPAPEVIKKMIAYFGRAGQRELSILTTQIEAYEARIWTALGEPAKLAFKRRKAYVAGEVARLTPDTKEGDIAAGAKRSLDAIRALLNDRNRPERERVLEAWSKVPDMPDECAELSRVLGPDLVALMMRHGDGAGEKAVKLLMVYNQPQLLGAHPELLDDLPFAMEALTVHTTPVRLAAILEHLMKANLWAKMVAGAEAKVMRPVLRQFPRGTALLPVQCEAIGQVVRLCSDINVLKTCLMQRFALDSVQEFDDKRWNSSALREVFSTLEKLPPAHTAGNPFITALVREKGDFFGSGGAYNDKITTYDDEKDKVTEHKIIKLDYTRGLTDDGLAETVRHEVGHAIDAQLNISATIGPTYGAGWRDYSDRSSDCINAMVAASGGYISKQVQASPDYPKLQAALQRFMGDKSLDAFKKQLGAFGFGEPAIEGILSDPVIEVLTKNTADKRPWDKSGGISLGDRIYQESYPGQWTSYLVAYRNSAAKVSGYQFRAPGEWFAEAYQCFYDFTEAEAAKNGRGFRLKAKDPQLYAYFVMNVETTEKKR